MTTATNQPSNSAADKQHLQKLVKDAPWVLRGTRLKGRSGPVLIVKERVWPDEALQEVQPKARPILHDRGLLTGPALKRVLPVVRQILTPLTDQQGIPLDLQRHLGNGSITLRGNLPLDREAGAKLALLFKLQTRLNDLDRIELIAWRIARLSSEEANYWWARTTLLGDAANRWAVSGLRLMLGGQPGDPAIGRMLTQLRQ